jgi:hypothetical protein
MFAGLLSAVCGGEIGGITPRSDVPRIIPHRNMLPVSLEIHPSILPKDGFIKKPFMRKKIRAAWLNWIFYPAALFLAGALFWFAIVRKKRFREYFLKWEMLGFLVYLTLVALTIFNSPRLTHADLDLEHYQFSLQVFFRSLLLVALPSVVQLVLNLVKNLKPSRAAADALLLFFWGYVYTATIYILICPMREFV